MTAAPIIVIIAHDEASGIRYWKRNRADAGMETAQVVTPPTVLAGWLRDATIQRVISLDYGRRTEAFEAAVAMLSTQAVSDP